METSNRRFVFARISGGACRQNVAKSDDARVFFLLHSCVNQIESYDLLECSPSRATVSVYCE